MYQFDAKDYGAKITKVYRVRFCLRGIYLEDVTHLATCVGIWPNRFGWGLGWVDRAQEVKEDGYRRLEVDGNGEPIVKRRYGLIKVEWLPGVEEREKYKQWLAEIQERIEKQEVEWEKGWGEDVAWVSCKIEGAG